LDAAVRIAAGLEIEQGVAVLVVTVVGEDGSETSRVQVVPPNVPVTACPSLVRLPVKLS